MYGTSLRPLLCLAAAVGPVLSQMTTSTGLVTGVSIDLDQSRYLPKTLSLISSKVLGNATEMTDNPEGVAFRAIFPAKQFFPTDAGLVKGIVLAETNPGGIGVQYNIKILNLPEEGGPFRKATRRFRR